MVERSNPQHPGYLTFEHGRVPDGHIVPNPPRPETAPAPLPEPDRRRALRLLAVVGLVAAVAIALGQVLS